MTKAELEKDRDEWKQQAESLQDDLDSLNEYVTELENENYELSNNKNPKSNCILDVERFRSRLALEGLYTQDLEQFIDEYLLWYNI